MTATDRFNTPCIGHCSTVFGDGVCRGCLRFVHEVIDWNRYTDEQKQVIWLRLEQQITQILPHFISIYDARLIESAVDRFRLPYQSDNVWHNVYNLLRFAERRQVDLGKCGFTLEPAASIGEVNARIYALASAIYERDFLRAAQIPVKQLYRD